MACYFVRTSSGGRSHPTGRFFNTNKKMTQQFNKSWTFVKIWFRFLLQKDLCLILTMCFLIFTRRDCVLYQHEKPANTTVPKVFGSPKHALFASSSLGFFLAHHWQNHSGSEQGFGQSYEMMNKLFHIFPWFWDFWVMFWSDIFGILWFWSEIYWFW